MSVRDERVTLLSGPEEVIHSGYVMDLVTREVDLGQGGKVRREYLRHPGAVAIVALDDAGRVLLLRQYRVPVGAYLWEVPAGLLDEPGESLVDAAGRELAEEADLEAGQWHTLVDYYTSPGASDELVRVFLARGLREVPQDRRHVREAEELGMQTSWVDLDDAADAVVQGRLHNPSAVVGILAASRERARDWAGLRPADAPRGPAESFS